MQYEIPRGLDDVIERVDHISVAVHDIAAALPLVGLLGGTFHDGDVAPEGGFTWIQFDLPGARLEMIAPTDAEDRDNFLVQFLERNGEGLHHVTLKVTDIELAIARSGDLGMDVVQINLSNPSWKEAFVHPRTAHGVLIQLAEWTDGTGSGRTIDQVIAGPQ